ncbi:MAG: hypothetical protein J6X53_10440 [Abditibacteriota bacterium]|nr:hypothetical protein [Abditibacteriota bacterium]
MRSGPGDHGKPIVRLGRNDGGIFDTLGDAARTLRESGQSDKAREMEERILSHGGAEDALLVMSEYLRR